MLVAASSSTYLSFSKRVQGYQPGDLRTAYRVAEIAATGLLEALVAARHCAT